MYRYALFVVVGLLVCCGVFFTSLAPSGAGQDAKADPGIERVKIFVESFGTIDFASQRLEKSLNAWIEYERPEITRVNQNARGDVITVFYKKKK